MQESLRLYDLEGINSTANVIDILDYLSFASAKQGNLHFAYELTKRILSYGNFIYLIIFIIKSRYFKIF